MGTLDQNRVYKTMGVSSDDNVTPQALKVSAVTGRLLVEITDVAETTSTQNSPRLDANNVYCSLAVDDNGDIKPLLMDSRNGYLFVDVTIE